MKLYSFDEFLNESAKYTTNKNHSTFALDGLHLRNQIHIFHWQTEVGDQHKALGEFYDSFLEKLDEVVEVTMGKYGRISVKGVKSTQSLIDLADVNVPEFVTKYIDTFSTYRDDTFSADPEIQNIIDEIIASMHKLEYLLTMS